MTTCSAACSLATEERPSPGTGGSAAPTGAGFGSVPVPSSPTHLPPPDKVNFPSSRSPACCVPPSEPSLLALRALCFAGPSCPAAPGFPVEGPWSIPWP